MRAFALFFVALIFAAGSAIADEKKEEPRKPPKPLSEEQAADAVLVAAKTKDTAALKALAEQKWPDPWQVADLLCYRGQHDAAEAFSKAAPRKTVEKLPEYVAARRGKEPDEAARKVLAAMNAAVAKSQWQQVLDLAGGVSSPVDSVVRIRVAYGRGIVLNHVGQHRASAKVLVEVGEAARRLGWVWRALGAFHAGGMNAFRGADVPGAVSALNSGLSVCREIGDKQAIAKMLLSLGSVQRRIGDYPAALRVQRESLAIFREIGDKRGVAQILGNIGNVQEHLGNYPESFRLQDQSLAAFREIGDQPAIARALLNRGTVQLLLGNYLKALRDYDEALAIFRESGTKREIARTLGSLGNARVSLGSYPEALRHFEQALTILREIDDKLDIARTLGSIGNLQLRLGDYPGALQFYEESLATFREIGVKRGVAHALGSIGTVQGNLGNYREALRCQGESLVIKRALNDKQGIAQTLGNIGLVHRRLGNHAEALRHFDEVVTTFREIGDKRGIAKTLGNIGFLQQTLGNHREALRYQIESLAITRAIGDKHGSAHTLGNIGGVQQSLGNHPEALKAYEMALRLLEGTPALSTQARVSWGLAVLSLHQGQPVQAAGFARDGVEFVSGLAEGLAEGEGAGARDVFFGLFETGIRSAVRAGQVTDLLWFLEQGRAGSLREGLGSRAALEDAVLPPKLRKALLEVRIEEQQALAAYRRAADSAKGEALRAWDESRVAVVRVAARIQRSSKSAAAIALATTDDLDAIRGYLRAGEALVLYGLTEEEGVALVVEPQGARMVALETSSLLSEKASDLLHLGRRPGTRGFHAKSTETRVDPVRAAAALGVLLVEPLGLGEHVKRVLVSPTGALGYVPFALLLPNREVAYVPSGTTYGLLLAERANQGSKILGIGNPDYETVVNEAAAGVYRDRGGAMFKLLPLPGTLKEVEGIGGVPLLGVGATESGVRSAIKKRERWRSVHFACHGLVDSERPMLSALAITADLVDDGFLTALEVFGMKIPADLVVMSACETGKGTVYKTEGILGLTHAFMFAGAPRVICSLWKVPDAATAALMIKFYELWNPKDGSRGLGAAAALKQAQAFIKSHDKWQDPYYWAAWVLWGLPD